ncbi:MAG: DUF4831 family protein [Paludibacteraceae bacterium]|nr:DUF4831 family protein [Paludibacteraceae bacterium]
MYRYLKISFFSVFSLLLLMPSKAENAEIEYYLPMTEIVLDVEYEQISHEAGMFYQYAERYLGTKGVITKDEQFYRLVGIKVHTHAKADKSRVYSVTIDKKNLQNINILRTKDGRLLSVNCEAKEHSFKPANKPSNARHDIHKNNTTILAPLQEDQMMASSTSKMAENTAKLIYRIREQRLNLLAGDTEHSPADGESMKLVLKELRQQEDALCELFVGKTTTQRMHKQIRFVPTASISEECLFRFSYFNGVVEPDDLSGEPVYITLVAQKTQAPEIADKKEKAPTPSPIYYNIPGSAQVKITDENNTWADETFLVAQFGYSQALPQDLFVKNIPQITFDIQTGNIISIK